MKSNFTRGILYACIAAIWWGMPQPLFFNEIKFIPSLEVAMHRGVWSFFVLFLSLLFLNGIYDFVNLFRSIRNIIILTITALLIATNWLGFIYSVSIDKVQDASLGYFLTPMISITLGWLILKENLNLKKIISVSLMLIACLILFSTSNTFPFLALLIGTTWGIYGLLRKQIQVSPATGLLFESGLISLFAVPYLINLNFENIGYFSFNFNYISIMLFLTGIVTIIPLFFFNLGLRHTTLGLAGVLFYIAPSFHFITSIFILNEYMEIQKLIAFVIIWIAVGIFIYDAVITSKLSRIKFDN
ncbi:EamA family transporter [Alphaproteobacteria bacterium]|nr:EamA family transporter [Alphaproteobacteria bacterium]